ncbi:MAG: site-specific integrase [Candidatus Omnitrophica bacterium]|nr:site-specific integrase [Candidatus Omnitrophota bacterium]
MNLPFLYNRADSRWWWYSWNSPTGRRRESCKPLKLSTDIPRDQALDMLLEYLQLKPKAPVSGTETLSWLQEETLRRVTREGRRESTIKEYRIALDHLIEILGRSYPVSEVKRSDIGRIQEHLLKNALPPTVNKILRHLQAAFNRLLDDEIIDRNPFRKFTRLREPDHPKHLSRTQIQTFLNRVEGEPREEIRRLIRLYLFTGRRRGEILTVRRENIDLARNTMRVINVKDRMRESQILVIPRAIRADVQWFLDHSERDEPFHICSEGFISKRVKKILREIGMGELHLHSLRHTFATLALMRGESVWKVKEWLGHSAVTVTEIYGHYTAEDEIDLGIEEKNEQEVTKTGKP